jgi:chromosome segregation ATPase
MAILPGGNEAYALIAIIADPAAAKKRLDELENAHAAVKQTQADAAARAKQAAEDRAAAEKARADLKGTLAAREASIASMEISLAKRIADHVAAEKDHDERAAALDVYQKTRTAELQKREADVTAREKAIEQMKAGTEAALVDAQALQSQWQDKMAKLKALQEG